MKISNKTLCITPDKVASYLSEFKYENQRPLSKQVVDRYAGQMQTGYWNPGSQINLAVFNDRTFLINGQHRLAAIVQSGIQSEFAVTTHYCENETEVAVLYGQLDTQKARSSYDLLHAAGLDDEMGMGSAETRTVGGAMKLLWCGLADNHQRKATMPQETLVGMMREWAPYVDVWDEMLNETPLHMRLQRSAILAVGLATLRWAPDREWTKSFWRAVSLDDGLRIGNPRKTLSVWVRDNFTRGETGRKITPQYTMHAVAGSWNAAVDGREFRQIRVPDERTPVQLAGVWPRKGNRHA